MRGGMNTRAYDTSNDPSLGRWRRAVSSWLGLFLLVFNLAAGGALPVQSSTLDLSSDHMIVCTVGGMAVVDRNGTPVPPEHAGVNGFCGACLPLLHGAVITPIATLLPQPFIQPLPRVHHTEAEPVLVERPLRLANPRAPPAA